MSEFSLLEIVHAYGLSMIMMINQEHVLHAITFKMRLVMRLSLKFDFL